MKQRATLLLFLCGCTPIVPVVNLPLVPQAILVPLDGQWVLADDFGGRSCLVIQEARVTIFDRTCSSDGRGIVARIVDFPVISRAGGTLTLSVTFNPFAFDDSLRRVTFTGETQLDGTFVGIRTDIDLSADARDPPVQVPATLSRL